MTLTDWLLAGKKRKAAVLLGSSNSNSTSGSASQPVAAKLQQQWRPVPQSVLPPNFDASDYKAGSFGDIVSFKRSKPQTLAPISAEAKGYLQVSLYSSSGKFCSLQTHKVVGTAFKGDKPGEGYELDHIDKNRHNNRADNLQWIPKEENGAKGGGVLPKVKTAIQLAYKWVAPTRKQITASEWRAIPKYPELQVSRTGGYIRRVSTGAILKPQCSASGHLYVKARVTIDGKQQQPDIFVHRAVFAAFIGQLLGQGYVVDHVDHNPWNNDADNLQQLTNKENSRRRIKLMAHNTSGTQGVYQCTTSGKWASRIFVDGWNIGLKRFSTKEEAIAHRDALEQEFSYGKYAASAAVRTQPVV